MSCSLPLPVAHSHHHQPAALSAVDGRDTVHYSPSLSASPLPPSPASTATPTSHLSAPLSLSDGQSPLSLASPAPALIPEETPPPPASAAAARPNSERVRSLIHGYSTSLIASAVREKAWSDLQRLEEIFASPSEQAHLTKQQKWKLALRQQRLKLYLQHEQLDQALQQPHTHHYSDAQEEEEQPLKSAEEEKVEEGAAPAASTFLAPPSTSLTIFTTPPLPPSHASISLAHELSSFSLYTPEGLSTTSGAFSFSMPLRSPSAPAEAAYSIPIYDAATTLHLSSIDSPSTPSSSSTSSSHSPSRPHRPPPPDPPTLPREEEPTVSRSGRPIKRKFELATLRGVRRGKKPSVGSEGEAIGVRRSSRAMAAEKVGGEEGGAGVRAWEREGGRDSEEAEEEEDDDGDEVVEEAAGRQEELQMYGVAYRH